MSSFSIKADYSFIAIKYSIPIGLAFFFFKIIPNGSIIDLMVLIVSFLTFTYLFDIFLAFWFHVAIFSLQLSVMDSVWNADFVLIAVSILGITHFIIHDKETSYKKEKEKSEAEDAYKKGNYGTASCKFKSLAEQGNATAQYALAVIYANGEGVAQDDVYAYMWLKIAIAKEHTRQCAKIDLKNHNLIRKIKRAGRFLVDTLGLVFVILIYYAFHKAGYTEFILMTYLTLGLAWVFCFVMMEKRPRTLIMDSLVSKALELSPMLEKRMNKTDLATAKKYAREYGRNNYKNVIGPVTIGMAVLIYFMITTIPFSNKWHRSAVEQHLLKAEQGYFVYQAYLGKMYFLGRGVQQDDINAHMWLNIAISQGHSNDFSEKTLDETLKTLNILEYRMSNADLATAQARAKKCVENHYKDC